MTATWQKLLGEQLLRRPPSDDQATTIAVSELNDKVAALYFSAHWCQPCRHFTPKLVQAYQEASDAVKGKLEIVFVSLDNEEDEFNEYFKEMPWKGLPFPDRERAKTLGERFKLEEIPALIVLSPSLETITSVAIEEVSMAPKEALERWSEGKSLRWSREPREGEHVWPTATCTGCFMHPLLGSRHACPNSECHVDLCDECRSKTKHEHPLIEHLLPTRQYSLEQLLATIPVLLDPKSDETIPSKSLAQEDVRCVGFYFGAHWCPPCQTFTPLLSKFYQEGRQTSPVFDVVFLSCDENKEMFDVFRLEMPWPAAPFRSHSILDEYFGILSLPQLVIVSSDGKIVTRKGFDAVEQHGIKALEAWSRGEKLTRPPADQYKWLHVACDACGTHPIVGERFSCATCGNGNYDLCAMCQKKGHEHELRLQPQPAEEE